MIMASIKRPLSPHLQVYKPQLTSMLSITHRGTGIFLTVGALLLSCWLVAVANGPDFFNSLMVHVSSWYGQCVLVLFLFSMYYHLCNGIRHLFWDAGLGLGIKSTYISGYVTIALSVILTILTWFLAGSST